MNNTNQVPKINLDNIRIIIMEPATPGNVGSLCRACKNMGLSDITLVNPGDFKAPEAYKFGWGAKDLINSCTVKNNLQDAVSDVHYSIATTNRARDNQSPLYSPKEVIEKIAGATESHKIAFVFGRENNGLSNDELLSCDFQSKIPSATTYPALNLSQAVMVYAYELFQASTETTSTYQWDLAEKKEVDRLYIKMTEAMAVLPYNPRNSHEEFTNLFKRVLGRVELESRDVSLFLKLFHLFITDDKLKKTANDNNHDQTQLASQS